MIRTAILLLILALPQQDFSRFTYCREALAGSFEALCIQLNPAGQGLASFKQKEGDEQKFNFSLSPMGTTQFLGVLSGTKYLANAKSYESKKKVANLGKKHLTLETPSGRREAEFNYSEMKDVTALVKFFEDLLSQQVLAVDLKWAMQFDLLGIPDRLERIEKTLKPGKIADPNSLIEVLESVSNDDRVLNYARTHARTLKEKFAAAK